jgi:hypothetical protein
VHEGGDFTDTPDVLRTVICTKAKILAEAKADIVAIKGIGMKSPRGQFYFNRRRNRRLSRS